MNARRLTDLSVPLQFEAAPANDNNTEALQRAGQKVDECRELVVDLTTLWINCFEVWRAWRDLALRTPSHQVRLRCEERQHQFETLLARYERDSATAEHMLAIAEQRYRRLLGVVS